MTNILLIQDNEIKPLEELKCKAMAMSADQNYLQNDDLLRVLRARNLDVNAAYEMWLKWYQWRLTYKPHEITEEEMMPHILKGKAFFHGEDKFGRPCLIVRFRYHNPEEFSYQDTFRYICYLVEKGIKMADEKGVGQICVLNDRGGITGANRDNKLVELVRSLAGMLQDFYAERLGAVYILHVNWFYWFVFQTVKVLINKKTREKLHVLRNTAQLKEFFNPDQLMIDYEGTDPYVHPYPN